LKQILKLVITIPYITLLLDKIAVRSIVSPSHWTIVLTNTVDYRTSRISTLSS